MNTDSVSADAKQFATLVTFCNWHGFAAMTQASNVLLESIRLQNPSAPTLLADICDVDIEDLNARAVENAHMLQICLVLFKRKHSGILSNSDVVVIIKHLKAMKSQPDTWKKPLNKHLVALMSMLINDQWQRLGLAEVKPGRIEPETDVWHNWARGSKPTTKPVTTGQLMYALLGMQYSLLKHHVSNQFSKEIHNG